MNEERDYLYLKGTEELGEVIDALHEIKAREVIVVIPRNTKCFLNSTNLSLLKHEINKLKKKVYFDTDDEHIISLAKEHGFDIFLSEYGVNEITKIVTDILPPQKTKPKIKKIVSRERNTDYDSDRDRHRKKKSKLPITTLVIIAIIIIGGIYLIFSNYLTSATLVIKIKSEKIPIEENLILSANASVSDLNKGILPAEYIEITKNHSIRQKTTGLKSGRGNPSGKVKFINTDKENSISIIPGTRIQSPQGNIYRTVERVNLEPGGEQEVNVFADKNDEKYYLSDLNTKFTIPGLKGTQWENKIEVILIEPIIASDETKIVSLDDINQGKLNLEKQLQEIVKQELKLKYSDYVFPEELGVFDIKFLNVSHSAGQQTDEIILTGSASLKTIGVKESVLKNFLKDVVSQQNLKKDLNFQIINLKINSFRMANFDLKNNELSVIFSGEAEIKGEIDSKKLLAEIAGKSEDEVKEVIEKYPQIEKADLTLYPYWSKKMPVDISKINVKIK